MRAINREDRELGRALAPHVSSDVVRLSIPRLRPGILKGHEPRLADRKSVRVAEGNPRFVGRIPANRGQQIPHHGDGQRQSHQTVQCDPRLHQQPTAGDNRGSFLVARRSNVSTRTLFFGAVAWIAHGYLLGEMDKGAAETAAGFRSDPKYVTMSVTSCVESGDPAHCLDYRGTSPAARCPTVLQ